MLSGAAAGALAMYIFDPSRGHARRAHLRDRVTHLEHEAEQAVGATRTDLRNRARGLIAELRGYVRSRQADDDVLTARVRAKIGRWVSHPHAIEIHAHDGKVTLHGPLFPHEMTPLLERVRGVRGVRAVENQLQLHMHPDVTMLHGPGKHLPNEIPWTPPKRVAATVSGLALVGRALSQRGPLGIGLGAIGLFLAARGLTNEPPQRWIKRGRVAATQ
jgi:hypothetical protein